MNQPNREPNPFITYLQSLADRDERGALAALRRGLGQAPGTIVEMYRYVVPWLPQKASRAQESAYYLSAALFALHPASTNSGNLGEHLARTRKDQEDDALERRFTTLLSAHADDLSVYLRQAVSFLKSKDGAINWDQLFSDVLHWDAEDHRVQKAWARAFWGRRVPEAETDVSDDQEE